MKPNVLKTTARRKGSYGIDAPYLLPIPAVLIVVNVANGVVSGSVWPFIAAMLILACMGCALYTSRRGKFVGPNCWTNSICTAMSVSNFINYVQPFGDGCYFSPGNGLKLRGRVSFSTATSFPSR